MQQISSILETLGIEPRYILVSIVGFLILLYVLMNFAFKPMVKTLNARQDKIRGDLDEAEAARNRMISLQRDYEQKLAAIEDEARDKIQSAVREAQLAREQMLAKAHEDAAAIMTRGQAEIEAERAKSLAEARNQIVDLATMMARQSTRQNLSAQGQSALIDDAIAKVGALN
jgi:F-type H+-transporting ATPase subunit b